MNGKRLPDYETFILGVEKKQQAGGLNAAERREELNRRKAADETWINRLAAEGKL